MKSMKAIIIMHTVAVTLALVFYFLLDSSLFVPLMALVSRQPVESFSGDLMSTVIGLSGTLAGFIFAGISILSTTTSTRYGRFLLYAEVYQKVYKGMFVVIFMMICTILLSIIGIILKRQTLDLLVASLFAYSAVLFVIYLVKLFSLLTSIADSQKAIVEKEYKEKSAELAKEAKNSKV